MRELPFNDYVEVRTFTVTRDAIGAEVLTPTALRSIWCRVLEVGGNEQVAANQQQGRRSVRVRCYADDVADVTPKMQIIHGSRTLNVDAVVRSDWGDRAVVECWERVQ